MPEMPVTGDAARMAPVLLWQSVMKATIHNRFAGSLIIGVCSWIMLDATVAKAQHVVGPVTETVTTLQDRDLNGTLIEIGKVVTERSRTSDSEEVVIETYLRSIEAGRLDLTERVRRVTRVTSYGSETIEEKEARSPVAVNEQVRVVRRTVTTVRKRGEAYESEIEIFEPDGNGRLMPVRKGVERTSRR
jgi:hypothetical protein